MQGKIISTFHNPPLAFQLYKGDFMTAKKMMIKARASVPLILGLMLLSSGCSTAPKPSAKPGSVALMAFNVENLFDAQADAGREDFTYLPLSLKGSLAHRSNCAKQGSRSRISECLELDWNQDVVNRKLSRLADVILSVNEGKGPDVLIMEEVENFNILSQLNDNYLKMAGYKHVILIEGPDLRGIDIGMLSRLPLVGEAKLHRIEFKPKTEEDKTWMARSRGVLEATFKLPSNDLITALGVHFPSQQNPSYWREQAIDFLNHLKSQLPKDRMVFVGGDFNISSEEDSRLGFFRNRLGDKWLVSHYVGCGNCVGTHMYKGGWSFLDALLFPPAMRPGGTAPWHLDIGSIEVIRGGRYQSSSFGGPARFSADKSNGVSDHYPILARIYPTGQAPETASAGKSNEATKAAQMP